MGSETNAPQVETSGGRSVLQVSCLLLLVILLSLQLHGVCVVNLKSLRLVCILCHKSYKSLLAGFIRRGVKECRIADSGKFQNNTICADLI